MMVETFISFDYSCYQYYSIHHEPWFSEQFLASLVFIYSVNYYRKTQKVQEKVVILLYVGHINFEHEILVNKYC